MAANALRKIEVLDGAADAPDLTPRPVLARKSKRAAPSQSVVKSAGRVLEILEYFDDIRREADLTEIAQLLSYPRSSASALLRSLVAMGYLQYRNGTRTYFPTPRVALLGHRKSPRFTRAGRALAQLRELREKTGENVVLVQRNGAHAQVIETLAGGQSCSALPGLGAQFQIATTGLGLALLHAASGAELRKLSNRLNADLVPAQRRLAQAALGASVQEVRARGYAEGNAGAGIRVLAFPLASDGEHAPLAIAIWGYEDSILAKKPMLLETALTLLGRVSTVACGSSQSTGYASDNAFTPSTVQENSQSAGLV